jgi:hypothetical protein
MPEQPAAMPDLLPPAPLEKPEAQEPAVVPQPRRRPGVLALSLLAIGFGLALAAQYMPWTVRTYSGSSVPASDAFFLSPADSASQSERTTAVELGLSQLSTAHVVTYLVTIALALTAIGVLIAAPGETRRIAAAASGGLLAANLLVLVGFKNVLDHPGASDYTTLLLNGGEAMIGPGYLLAFASVLVFVAGVVLASRDRRVTGSLIRFRREVEPDGAEPLELTVTPVPPTFQ